MTKITVMVPVEIEISMHPSGRIRVGACKNPTLIEIENLLQAFPESELTDYRKYLAIIDGWVIVKK